MPEVLEWGVDGGYEYIIVSAMCCDDCLLPPDLLIDFSGSKRIPY